MATNHTGVELSESVELRTNDVLRDEEAAEEKHDQEDNLPLTTTFDHDVSDNLQDGADEDDDGDGAKKEVFGKQASLSVRISNIFSSLDGSIKDNYSPRGRRDSISSLKRRPSLRKAASIQFHRKSDKFHTKEREEELWMGPFIDLIYVSTIFNMSHFVRLCGDHTEVYILLTAYFTIMFMTRFHIDTYQINFMTNDLENRVVYCVYMLGVFLMTLDIAQNSTYGSDGGTDDEGSSHRRGLADFEKLNTIGNCREETEYNIGFAAGFVFTRVVLLVLYSLRLAFGNHVGATYNVPLEHFRFMLPLIFSALVMCCIFFRYSPVWVLPAASGVEVLLHILMDLTVKSHIRTNTKELQSRLGLFFMLVLGESMLGLLVQAYRTSRPFQSYRVLLLAFALVFAVGMQYFDTAISMDGNNHAMTNGKRLRRLAFFYCNPIAAFFMLVATIGIVALYENASSIGETSDNVERDKVKVAIGMGMVAVTLVTMRGLHDDAGLLHYLMEEPLTIALKGCCAVIHFTAWLYPVNAFLTLFIHAFLVVSATTIEILYIIFGWGNDQHVIDTAAESAAAATVASLVAKEKEKELQPPSVVRVSSLARKTLQCECGDDGENDSVASETVNMAEATSLAATSAAAREAEYSISESSTSTKVAVVLRDETGVEDRIVSTPEIAPAAMTLSSDAEANSV